MQVIYDAATDTASERETTDKGWLHMHRYIIRPLMDHRIKILNKERTSTDNEDLKQQCIEARQKVDEAMSHAKSAWAAHQAEIVASIPYESKMAWTAISWLKTGLTGHHSTPRTVRLKKPDGTIATLDEYIVEVFKPHFHKVFNRQPKIHWPTLDLIKGEPVCGTICGGLKQTEFDNAIKSLAWQKAPGPNQVSPNAINALDSMNRNLLFTIIKEYFDTDTDITPWHEAKLVPVEKKRRHHGPKQLAWHKLDRCHIKIGQYSDK